MKNITLSADENLIEVARQRAVAKHTTLNVQFRLWLDEYVRRKRQADTTMETIAANAIQGMCQVRAFGDLVITSMNSWKWNELLEKASKFAQWKQ